MDTGDAKSILLERLLRTVRREAPLWIYAIQAGDDGPIKIGTTQDPRQRLLTLQTANAARLRPLALWRGFPVEERFWHRTFAEERLEGEWFRPSPQLIAILRWLDGVFVCEWHCESECLSGLPGTCKACGVEFFD